MEPGDESINSTNEPPNVILSGERSPLVSRMGFLRNIFRSRPNVHESGYVDFGSQDEPSSTRTLETFSGVFSPVALSMFSALLFLRVGFLIGNAGLLWTIVQFVIAYIIMVFTVWSICAISTNGAVEGGGAYFMISRTLGPEFGGSIGTIFFLANVVSSGLYITGCVEGIVENFGPGGYMLPATFSPLPDGVWWRFLYCSFLNFLNLLVCLTGASMFAKTSVFTLGVVCVCLLSSIVSFLSKGPITDVPLPAANTLHPNITTAVYTGLSSSTFFSNLNADYSEDYTSITPQGARVVDFAVVFGVLFSGVTGIMAGANMSGELKDPARSIPKGTLRAVFFTFVCYIVLSCFVAASCTRFLLQNNYLFLLSINLWPPFITIGIVSATFSASLSNFIGSSRVLEALAKDNVYGILLNFVKTGTWKGNPIAAVFVSFALVELILLIGSLNVIAQINSILFLLSYLSTNLACLCLEVASAPNFRPSFNFFSWHTALLGMIATLAMMFVTNLSYAFSSIGFCFVLFVLLHLFSPSRQSQWGSISQALIFHQVRKYLLLLDSRKEHVKFWRPQILLLVNNPRTCCPLITFVNDIKKGGLYVIGHVQTGQDFFQLEEDPTIEEYPHWLSLVDHLKVKAFVELTLAKSVREGFHHLVRISGMGAMKPNTIFLGFYDKEPPMDFLQIENSDRSAVWQTEDVFKMRDVVEKNFKAPEYVNLIIDVFKMKKNLCVCRHFQKMDQMCERRKYQKTTNSIDIWPTNFFCPNENDPFSITSLFMLQLACILQMVRDWRSLPLRVFICENKPEQALVIENKVKQLLHSLRIRAQLILVSDWPECYSHLAGGSLYSPLSSQQSSFSYLIRINQMIRRYSENTATCFMTLPMEYPKGEVQDGTNEAALEYLKHLTALTNDLPPTVLVHGVHGVTSTTL